jgi:antitoxin component HigA of HigAB toxin-antitoxin module
MTLHVDPKATARFEANVCPEPNTGCFLWMGSYSSSGYGAFSYGRQIGAHVFSFVAENGEVPLGCVVHHKCNNPACVNPGHLEAKTASENVILGVAHARAMGHIHSLPKRREPLDAPRTASERLSAHIIRRGISKQDFADQIGVANSTLSRLLNGRRRPTLEQAQRIFEETKGNVTPKDWLVQAQEGCEAA